MCAAMFGPELGDIYIDDALHYILSVEKRLIVSENSEDHKKSGQWWWRDSIPSDVIIDAWRLIEPTPPQDRDGRKEDE